MNQVSLLSKFKIITAIIIVTVISLLLTGCAAQISQGWSGCSSSGVNIIYGSMDSRIVCINPEARNLGLSFPSKDKGEWYSQIKGPAVGGMCGPFGCAPQSSANVAIYTTPVISNDLVYIASYYGKIYAFNLVTGAERWIYPRDISENIGGIVGNILLVEDTLYVNSSNGSVYALEKNTGDKKWEFKTGDRIWTAPAYANGSIFVGSYDGNLYCIASTNGNQLWSIKLPATISSSPVVYKDKVILGSFDYFLYAFNQVDGSLVWKFKGNNWFWAEPIISNSTIYAANLDHNIYALNGDDGSKIWIYNTGDRISSRPALINEMFAVVSENGELHLVSTKDGILHKKISVGYKVIAPLLAVNNIVYIHGVDDYVYSVDINTGNVAWKFKAGKE